MRHSAGIIPYKIENDELKFFVGHPGGKSWEKRNYWALLKGGVENGEDLKSAAIREFKEESGLEISNNIDLVLLGTVRQNPSKNVTAFSWKVNDIDTTKCYSNMADNGLNPEIDSYKWLNYDEIVKYTHKTHIPFYDKIIENFNKTKI